MESIEQRAKSYAEGCELQGKEEKILVSEWLERNAPQVVARFKTDFGIELPKYYGDDDSRVE